MVARRDLRCDLAPIASLLRLEGLSRLVSLRLSLVSCAHRWVDRTGLSSLNKELLIEKCYAGAAADAQSARLTVAVGSLSVFEN